MKKNTGQDGHGDDVERGDEAGVGGLFGDFQSQLLDGAGDEKEDPTDAIDQDPVEEGPLPLQVRQRDDRHAEGTAVDPHPSVLVRNDDFMVLDEAPYCERKETDAGQGETGCVEEPKRHGLRALNGEDEGEAPAGSRDHEGDAAFECTKFVFPVHATITTNP